MRSNLLLSVDLRAIVQLLKPAAISITKQHAGHRLRRAVPETAVFREQVYSSYTMATSCCCPTASGTGGQRRRRIVMTKLYRLIHNEYLVWPARRSAILVNGIAR